MTTKNHKTTKPIAKRSGGGVFDIRRPGKAPAPATSRPIIGHKLLGQKAQIAVSGVGESPLMLNPVHKIAFALQPPANNQEPDEKPAYDPEETPLAPIAPTVQPLAKTEVVAEKALDSTTQTAEPPTPQAPEPVPEKPAAVPPVPDPLLALLPQEPPAPTPVGPASPPNQPPSPATASKPTPDQVLADIHIDPLFDERGVIVSHHKPTASAWKIIGLVLLIILLAAATLNILLDMDILTLDGIPHTDFLID